MQLLTAFGLLMVMWTVSATTQKQDWTNVQYSEPTLDDEMSTHDHSIMQLLGKNHIGNIKSFTSTFQLLIRERYGAECSNGVMQAILSAADCIKPTLDMDKLQTINRASIMQKVMTGEIASTFCPLIDLESVFTCIQDLETSVKVACTGDQLISNVVRIIDAEVSVARRMCRDGGKRFDDGMREVLKCRGNNQRLMSSSTNTCNEHNQRMLIDGIDKSAGVNAMLKMLQNMSKICRVLSESANCVPAALEHCSPLLAKFATEATYEDLLPKICGYSVPKSMVGNTIDEHGVASYSALVTDGSTTRAAVSQLVAMLVALMAYNI